MTNLLPRVSLRTLLVALVAAGAAIGLGGRLFQRDPSAFINLVGVATMLVPPALAVLTVVWLGVRLRRGRLLVWGIALGVLPLLGLLTVSILRNAGGVHGYGLLSTERLIGEALPAGVDEPWTWRELAVRLENGRLSDAQVDRAVEALVNHLRTAKPGGWNQPLSWQDEFLEPALAAGRVSQPKVIALCDAFYGPVPRLQPETPVHANNPYAAVNLHWGNPWDSSVTGLPRLAWRVAEVQVDGQRVQDPEIQWHRHRRRVRFPMQLPPGDHEVQVTVAAAYLRSTAVTGDPQESQAAEQLPRGIKNWSTTVNATLTVEGE